MAPQTNASRQNPVKQNAFHSPKIDAQSLWSELILEGRFFLKTGFQDQFGYNGCHKAANAAMPSKPPVKQNSNETK